MKTTLSKGGNAARFLGQIPPTARAFLAQQGVTVEGDHAPELPAAAIEAPPQAPAKPQPFKRARERQKLNKRQRAAQRRHQAHERTLATERRILDRVGARIQAAGGTSTPPALVPVSVWRIAWQIVGDASGGAARVHIRNLKNKAAAALIVQASLGASDREDPRSWAQLRTRRIAALGVALVLLAAPTHRRRDRWGGMVKGIPRGALAAMLHDPYDTRDRGAHEYKNGRAAKRPGTPSISALFGIRGVATDDRGYFQALADVGLVYAQQLPAELVTACERTGPSGHATNRYWVVSGEPSSRICEQTASELLAIILAGQAIERSWRDALHRRGMQPPPKPPPS